MRLHSFLDAQRRPPCTFVGLNCPGLFIPFRAMYGPAWAHIVLNPVRQALRVAGVVFIAFLNSVRALRPAPRGRFAFSCRLFGPRLRLVNAQMQE